MPSQTTQEFADFIVDLSSHGLREALAKLVKKTDYRFIGIWRFKDGKANAAVHYDQENPAQEAANEVEQTATYCCYVRDAKAPFKTANALLDERLNAHPARDAVLTYAGVPLVDFNGEVIGTLCFYDVVPRDPAQIDLGLALKVASYLSLGNHVPPYPAAA